MKPVQLQHEAHIRAAGTMANGIYAHQVEVTLTDTITGAALPAPSWFRPAVIEDQTNSANDEVSGNTLIL